MLFLFTFAIIWSSVLSDDIPAWLWNIKGDALSMKPVSALEHGDHVFYENLKDALNGDNSKILVFAVNKLSLEDFQVNSKHVKNNSIRTIVHFLDSRPHMLLPSVKDPLNYINKAAECGVQEMVVANEIDYAVIQALSILMQKNCVVVLQFSADAVVVEEIQNVLISSFDSATKSIIGVFTGVKSSWPTEGSEHHMMFRNLLQSEVSDNFLNYTGCMIMYAQNASIRVKEENKTALPFPPDMSGSTCGNLSSILQLKFKTSGYLSSVTLKLNFTRKFGSWITNGSVSMTGEKAVAGQVDLISEFVTAATGFSYSCGQLVLRGKKAALKLEIVFNRFQVQPFKVKGPFSDSFDCVPFFTAPIWMGVFISIFFVLILHLGIYALFSINSMDRFDDPKGKTISVGAASD